MDGNRVTAVFMSAYYRIFSRILRNRGIGLLLEFRIEKNKLREILPFFVFLALFFVTSPARSEIYVYKDKAGIRHFTNTPTSGKFTAYMNETPMPLDSWTTDASYDTVIAEAARRNGLSFYLLKALIHVESYFNPHAVSKKGALGLMQIMPENLRILDIKDPFDPWDNIMGGAGYLNSMIKRFNGHLDLALAAYNAGPSVVEYYNGIPPYRETQEYVKKVLRYYRYYQSI